MEEVNIVEKWNFETSIDLEKLMETFNLYVSSLSMVTKELNKNWKQIKD